MAKKRIPIDKDAFEYLKYKVLEVSGIKLSFNNAYLDLYDFVTERSKQNFSEPKGEDGKIIQRRESVSVDTLRRYWGEKDADKEMTPDVGKLSVLTQAIGYADWEEFLGAYKNILDNEYTKVDIPHFSNPDDIDVFRLSVGKILSLGVPQKYITLKLIDDATFLVLKSVNTSLIEGNFFMADSFRIERDENLTLPKIIIVPIDDEEEPTIIL